MLDQTIGKLTVHNIDTFKHPWVTTLVTAVRDVSCQTIDITWLETGSIEISDMCRWKTHARSDRYHYCDNRNLKDKPCVHECLAENIKQVKLG